MASKSNTGVSYDEFQQVYCLSSAAGVVGEMKGTSSSLQKAMQASLHKDLPRITGSWDVAWGPAVYKKNPEKQDSGPTNAWYVAKDDTQKTCVVSIAGTAVTSIDAWLGDLDVLVTVPFYEWISEWTDSNVPWPDKTVKWGADDGRSLCSRSTCIFIWNILNTSSPENGASPDTTIVKFLQNLQKDSPDYKIVFTGHSMGGAVCPAMALGLVEAKLINGSNVRVCALAGPSPGNAPWNANFSKNFPASDGTGYQRYNTVFYNNLDIVPQAWSIRLSDDRNLSRIFSRIYHDMDLGMWSKLFGAVIAAAAFLKPVLLYAPLPGSAFTGPKIDHIGTQEEFGASATMQHTRAYWQEIGIQDFVDNFAKTVLARPGVEPLSTAAYAGMTVGDSGGDTGVEQKAQNFEQQIMTAKTEARDLKLDGEDSPFLS